MGFGIDEYTLWCVYTHKVIVLMSTHSMIESKALVLEVCVVIGSCPFLVSPKSRYDLLLFALCCLRIGLATSRSLC